MTVHRRLRTGLASDERRTRRRTAARPAVTTADIQRGLAAAEFSLVYQPEVALDTRRIVAVEALSRWHRRRAGLVGPDDFIPSATSAAALSDFDRWVIRTAMAQFAAWCASIPRLDITIRVNAGAGAVADDDLAANLSAALAEFRIRPEQVCLELTESAWSGDPERVVAGVQRVQRLGSEVALDDFGAGHSGLGRLRAIPVDVIKIDRQLVAGIDSDPRARSIVAATLELAAELGVHVTAEGVERQAEADVLRELGCRAAQGYLFGAPVDAADMTAALTAQFPDDFTDADQHRNTGPG